MATVPLSCPLGTACRSSGLHVTTVATADQKQACGSWSGYSGSAPAVGGCPALPWRGSAETCSPDFISDLLSVQTESLLNRSPCREGCAAGPDSPHHRPPSAGSSGTQSGGSSCSRKPVPSRVALLWEGRNRGEEHGSYFENLKTKMHVKEPFFFPEWSFLIPPALSLEHLVGLSMQANEAQEGPAALVTPGAGS